MRASLPLRSNKAPAAGTYIYSDTLNNTINREMGMYGVLKVGPVGGGQTVGTGGPAYNFERIWVMSEMDKTHWNDVAALNSNVKVVDTRRALRPFDGIREVFVLLLQFGDMRSDGHSCLLNPGSTGMIAPQTIRLVTKSSWRVAAGYREFS